MLWHCACTCISNKYSYLITIRISNGCYHVSTVWIYIGIQWKGVREKEKKCLYLSILGQVLITIVWNKTLLITLLNHFVWNEKKLQKARKLLVLVLVLVSKVNALNSLAICDIENGMKTSIATIRKDFNRFIWSLHAIWFCLFGTIRSTTMNENFYLESSLEIRKVLKAVEQTSDWNNIIK